MTYSQNAYMQQNQAFVEIDNDLIEVLLKHKSKGDRLMFMRSHNGQIKIKIKHGPMKWMVKRFITNNATFEQIKKEIALAQ